jgi:hypothetical protein
MSKPMEVTVAMAIDRTLLMQTSIQLLAIMAGKTHEEFTKAIFSESNQVRTKFINDLFVSADLDEPAGVTKLAVAVLETVKAIYDGFPFDGTRNVFRIASKMCGAIELDPRESHSVFKRNIEPDTEKEKDVQFIHGDFSL